ncbi:MAG: hypothetical protein P9X22_07845 [Candidatus Zapsychrus exili]|nr:hypothetical protein [Candidatus Zapsychrus exili]
MKKNKIKSIILRFDADKKVGMGHFSRCCALGKSLKENGFEVLYCCRYFDKEIVGILKRSKVQYILIPKNISWKDEAQYIFDKLALKVSGVILDVSTVYALNNTKEVSFYIKSLRRRCLVTLIDGMRDNSLLLKSNCKVDIVVIPYFGAEDFKQKKTCASNYLIGPKYFIFHSQYSCLKKDKRNIRKVAKKILVTFGGSDPSGTTMKVLRAISKIEDRNLHIRIAVGACFPKSLRSRIERFRDSNVRHKIDVLDSPASLFKHMLWCDIAITNSGLTKYELALTGTPSLQISLNEDHTVVNMPFKKNGSTKHMGVDCDISSDLIAAEIVALFDNSRERCSMSVSGQKMLDGLGSQRIIEMMRRKL